MGSGPTSGYAPRVSAERPFYFPVKAEPWRMQPGLFRFGTDFGNGEADRSYFPRDAAHAHYVSEKRRVLAAHPERARSDLRDDQDRAALDSACQFIVEANQCEGHTDVEGSSLAEVGPQLAEDFAVTTRADRVVWVHACFPSGWRPEHVLGQSFARIHQHVPAFQAVAQKAPSLVEAMLSRGPYVRFVWTIAADPELDHHPEQGRRVLFDERAESGFLRVERQTTIPLAGGAASLFLIRTYLYAFEELSAEDRATLASALRQIPAEIAEYKRLTRALPRALELLR